MEIYLFDIIREGERNMFVCDVVYAGIYFNYVFYFYFVEWFLGGDVIIVRFLVFFRYSVIVFFYFIFVCVNRVNYWKSLIREIKEYFS